MSTNQVPQTTNKTLRRIAIGAGVVALSAAAFAVPAGAGMTGLVLGMHTAATTSESMTGFVAGLGGIISMGAGIGFGAVLSSKVWDLTTVPRRRGGEALHTFFDGLGE